MVLLYRSVTPKTTHMSDLSNVQGLLCDLDGVIYVDDEAVPGSIDAVRRLKERGVTIRFVTNTSASPQSYVLDKLIRLGVPVDASEVFTATVAARHYLESQGIGRIFPVVNPEVREEFEDLVAASDAEVEAVLIGEIGDGWNYQLLNRLFHLVLNGAQLVTMHKSRFWKVSSGLRLGLGSFVAALEYGTGTEAVVIGKPMPSFFELGVASLGLDKSEVAMIGDDIDSDVGGAQAYGLKGILVRSGKYNEAYVQRSAVQPDLVVDGLRALPLLEG